MQKSIGTKLRRLVKRIPAAIEDCKKAQKKVKRVAMHLQNNKMRDCAATGREGTIL